MRQLTGLDATFLALDSPTVRSHLGCMAVLDPPARDPALNLLRLTELIESRLHLAPPFRRRLAEVPFGLDQPYWIEDPHFDIEFHVRELALPAPGDDHQLATLAARLHERPLDRRRPLWEMYLIHGLAGDRGVKLLARSAVSAARHPFRLARVSAELMRSLPALANSSGRPRLPVVDRLVPGRGRGAVSAPPLIAPHTPFNKMLGPRRRCAFGNLPLAKVKQIKNSAGVTVNDVVMALCAGALRTWLRDHHALPAGPLLAAVPVSIRAEDQKATEGNRLSKVIAPLPTHLSDPGERLRAMHEAMEAAKDQFSAMPTDLFNDIAQFSMPALADQACRLANRLRLLERISPLNLFVSNVPGSTVDMYMGGSRLHAVYPMSTIADGQGLNITVLGSRGKLNVGMVADPDLVPDVDAIMNALVDELALLHTAVNRRQSRRLQAVPDIMCDVNCANGRVEAPVTGPRRLCLPTQSCLHNHDHKRPVELR